LHPDAVDGRHDPMSARSLPAERGPNDLRSGLQVDSLGAGAVHCRVFDALFGVAPLE
jgi:hypothetical protein